MDKDTLKDVFRSGLPVLYEGVEYNFISALIYRRVGKAYIVQAELMDRNKNSVVIACPERITVAGMKIDPDTGEVFDEGA